MRRRAHNYHGSPGQEKSAGARQGRPRSVSLKRNAGLEMALSDFWKRRSTYSILFGGSPLRSDKRKPTKKRPKRPASATTSRPAVLLSAPKRRSPKCLSTSPASKEMRSRSLPRRKLEGERAMCRASTPRNSLSPIDRACRLHRCLRRPREMESLVDKRSFTILHNGSIGIKTSSTNDTSNEATFVSQLQNHKVYLRNLALKQKKLFQGNPLLAKRFEYNRMKHY